jgi:hypothetical protein
VARCDIYGAVARKVAADDVSYQGLACLVSYVQPGLQVPFRPVRERTSEPLSLWVMYMIEPACIPFFVAQLFGRETMKVDFPVLCTFLVSIYLQKYLVQVFSLSLNL